MLAIRAARMFDGERFTNGGVTVLIDDGRIVGVEQGLSDVPDGWRVIDHPDATVLPGLIDTHVHLVTDSGMGAWIASSATATTNSTRSSPMGCVGSWSRVSPRCVIWEIGGSTSSTGGIGSARVGWVNRNRPSWRRDLR